LLCVIDSTQQPSLSKEVMDSQYENSKTMLSPALAQPDYSSEEPVSTTESNDDLLDQVSALVEGSRATLLQHDPLERNNVEFSNDSHTTDNGVGEYCTEFNFFVQCSAATLTLVEEVVHLPLESVPYVRVSLESSMVSSLNFTKVSKGASKSAEKRASTTSPVKKKRLRSVALFLQ